MPARSSLGPVLTAVLAGGLLGWALWPLIALEAVPRWDGMAFYAPAFSMLADHLRGGELLLWNPWVGGGRPEAADPQVGVFSPYVLAMALLTGGGFRGYAITLWLSWWLGGVGMLFLGRHLRAPAWGSLVACLAFVSCGFFVGHAEHGTFVHGLAALPWITWRLDVALARRAVLPALQAGAIWGVAALGGYPGVTIGTALWMGLWTLGRWALRDDEEPRPGLRAAAAALVAALALGVVVMSPAYLAFLVEGRSFTDRAAALGRKAATQTNALPPGALRSFASPAVGAMKVEEEARLWPPAHPAMVSVHLGLVATSLGLAALVGRRRAFRLFVAAAGLLFLAAAMGSALPIRGWLYDLLPPMRFFRHSAFLRGFALFALAVLALWGSRDLADPRPARRRWSGLAVALTTVALGGVATLSLRDVFRATAHPGRSLSYELTWALGVLALTGALALANRRQPKPAVFAGLALLAVVEGGRALAVSAPLLSTQRWPPWVASIRPHETGRPPAPDVPFERSAEGSQTATNLHLLTGEPRFYSYEPMVSRQLFRWMRDARLKSWVVGADRLWFGPAAAVRGHTIDDFEAFREATARVGAPLLWLHEDEPAGAPDGRLVADPDVATLQRIPYEPIEYRQRYLAIRLTAPADGWLWVTDRYARGWRAWVDGAPTPIHRASFLFRAVALPAGEHVLTMRYTPFGHPWLLLASWGTLAAVVVASLARRRGQPPAVVDPA